MCGLDFGLIVGAHIYPANAPKSPDKVWNGIALCYNHHAAFDNHMIWVHPTKRTISLRNDLLNAARLEPAIKRFVESTFGQLSSPNRVKAAPRSTMFRKRYSHYPEHYKWVGKKAKRFK